MTAQKGNSEIDAGERPQGVSREIWSAWAQAAAVENHWEVALARWEACLEKFGQSPGWLGNRARALKQLRRLEEAELAFAELAQRFPKQPGGLAGLAWLADEKSDWESAAVHWARFFELFPEVRSPKIVIAYARARSGIGQWSQAQLLLRQLAQAHPENQKFKALVAQGAIEEARREGKLSERFGELRAYIDTNFGPQADVAGSAEGVALFEFLGDGEMARGLLMRTIERAVSIDEAEILLATIPSLIAQGSRGALWEKLLLNARSAAGTLVGLELSKSAEIELRLLLALERFGEFAKRFDDTIDILPRNRRFHMIGRVRQRLAKSRSDVFSEPKVFGIGLSRTGTRSLNEALTALGIDAGHWTNPLTHQVISDIDIFMLGGCTDISVAQNFEKLYYQYPNARFVWTQRPLESWISAFKRHYASWHGGSDFTTLRLEFDRESVRHGFSNVAVEFALYLNATGPEEAGTQYEARVRRFFSDKPKDKILEFDVFSGHGWAELCRFLRRPVPERPFPFLNRSA